MRGQRSFSINYVPWDELQQFRCKEIEQIAGLGNGGMRCKEHACNGDYHAWTLGNWAFYVPTELHAGYVAKALAEAREYLVQRGFVK